jgi:hypothetical protein
VLTTGAAFASSVSRGGAIRSTLSAPVFPAIGCQARLAIEREPQDFAQWLVRILGRRHALPLAHRQEQKLAVRRKRDLGAELSASTL